MDLLITISAAALWNAILAIIGVMLNSHTILALAALCGLAAVSFGFAAAVNQINREGNGHAS